MWTVCLSRRLSHEAPEMMSLGRSGACEWLWAAKFRAGRFPRKRSAQSVQWRLQDPEQNPGGPGARGGCWNPWGGMVAWRCPVLGRKQIPPLVDTCISPTHLCPQLPQQKGMLGLGGSLSTCCLVGHTEWAASSKLFLHRNPSVLFFLCSLLPSHSPTSVTPLHLP